MIFRPLKRNKYGFTVVELIVSVAIFAFMTAFLIVKYGTFNKSILLTNTAYDVALAIRNAQTYGLNVKSRPSSENQYSNEFQVGYGVHLSTKTASPFSNRSVIFYADSNGNKSYTPGNNEDGEILTKFTLRNGIIIKKICVGASQFSCSSINDVSIIFNRPDPKALINASVNNKYAEITIATPTDEEKTIVVRSNGQIAVLQGGLGTDPSASPTVWGQTPTGTPTETP